MRLIWVPNGQLVRPIARLDQKFEDMISFGNLKALKGPSILTSQTISLKRNFWSWVILTNGPSRLRWKLCLLRYLESFVILPCVLMPWIFYCLDCFTAFWFFSPYFPASKYYRVGTHLKSLKPQIYHVIHRFMAESGIASGRTRGSSYYLSPLSSSLVNSLGVSGT